MHKEKRIIDLLKMPRMFYSDFNNPTNQLYGLQMLISDYVNNKTVMAEIGSFTGLSSELFALHAKEVHCIDAWGEYWEIEDSQIMEYAEFSFDKMRSDYKNIHKIKGTSIDSSNLFDDQTFDFVYIDAAHDFNSVVDDINSWVPKIKPGGIIGGHDYKYDPNIGVYEAVRSIFGDKKIITYPDSSFVVEL